MIQIDNNMKLKMSDIGNSAIKNDSSPFSR